MSINRNYRSCTCQFLIPQLYFIIPSDKHMTLTVPSEYRLLGRD
jgi:hypothetical protein